MADNALGRFLRARRETTSPDRFGLPVGRRRTPGLRRAEVADLAGISVEYLIRLERGSDRQPSASVIASLADVFGLAPEERVHLHRLVKAGTTCTHTPEPLRPTVQALLDRLDHAYVVNPAGDLLAHSEGFRALAAPTGLLDASNTARFTFTDPRARVLHPDWDAIADTRAAGLRAAADLGDRIAAQLVDELTIVAGHEFTSRAGAALPRWTGVERWAHPAVGELRLAFEGLVLPGGDEHRLVVLLPDDDVTAKALLTLEGEGEDRSRG
ncbi:helix-turn-helix domain-containing protein [Saccharothrix variisporea]|uniref:helix-turn-helix domain-containing protein n=1 Tax=Saccharothrix variisporea TaxID=543527 RepID=UPI000EB21436|nr:helix-turn-helix domain-containing protein [Saccharothrix variisporea]